MMINQTISYIFQIQHMSTKPASDNLPKYLAIAAALGIAYYAITHLTNSNQNPKSKSVPIDTIRNILKEVKYQVYASCIPYSQSVEKKLKAYPKKDVDIYLRTELTKAYEAKEDLILTKYQVSKDEYALALNAYHKDKQVKRDTEEILKVLEETVRGEIDLSVPEQAAKLYNSKELVKLYHEMCVDIGVAVWQKLMECIKNNPAFNAKDDAHFRQAMRELGIYDFKVLYLANKGFKTEWGCPNFTFLKLLEDTKRKVEEVRNECFYIEKGYEEIITKISAHPEDYNKVFINRIMDDTINRLKNPVKVPVQPNPVVNQPPKPQAVQQPPNQPVFQPVRQVQPAKPVIAAPPAVEEDEFDMEKLMMEELLSRSQQISKEEPAKKVEASVVVESKPEPVSRGIDVKLYAQEKVEHEQKKEVSEKPRIVSVGIGFGDEQEEIPVSVVEQAPSIIEPESKVEQVVVENVPSEAQHTAHIVVSHEQQFVRDEVPAQIPEVPAADQPAVEQVVAQEPVQAEPQLQQEPQEIHNVQAAQEVVQPPAEIAAEQQILPEQPVVQPIEAPVEQPVEPAVEKPEQAEPAVEEEN